MNGHKRVTIIVWLLVLGLIGFGCYSSGARIQYYADDFQWVFDSPSSQIPYYLFHKNPVNGWYRPIQASFLALVQTYFGLETLPIHLTQISMHILLSWLVFVCMVKLGFSSSQAIVGSLFMIVAQANVLAVLSNDTLSQVGATFFGCVSLWLLYRFSFNTKGSKDSVKGLIGDKNYFLSILIFIVSLLSKESSVSFFPLLLGVVLLRNLKIKKRTSSINRTIIEVSPYVIVTAVYFAARLFIGVAQPTFGSGRYQFRIGINILRNLAMFFFAASIPTSSVTAFAAFKNGELATLSVIVIMSFVFSAWVAYGLWCSNRRGTISLLGIFAIIGLFPMAMMNHVSELYVYNSIPFISILVGVGLGRHLELSKVSRIRQGICTALIALLFMSHVMATQSKAFLMEGNGERATILLSQIEPYTYRVPKNGHLLLLNPPSNQVEYSVFLMRGFNVLKDGLVRIEQLSGRDDFAIKIIELSEIEQFRRDCLILSLYDETVEIYQEQP